MITKEIEIKQFIRRFLACEDDPIVDATEISAKQTPKGKGTHKHIHTCKYFLAILKKFYEIIGRKQAKSALTYTRQEH